MGRFGFGGSGLCCVATFVFSVLLHGQVAAQSTGVLTGRVVDQGGDPVAGATVAVGSGPRALSDGRGDFLLPGVPAGSQRVLVSAPGFVDQAIEVVVGTAGATDLRIRLTNVVSLEGITVEGTAMAGAVLEAPDISGGMVLAGTGNTIVQMDGLAANLSEKTARQIFARVPGAFAYDMDGSGNQVNVSTRGLDPHRSWELNVRQDGVLLNSDLYGYPASHYSPPMEAIERLEVIRGTAALQYGSQYGGLVNYVTKSPQTDRAVGGESVNTVGSYGLFSTFNAAGGEIGPVTWYGYLNERRSDGYREGSTSDFSAQFLKAAVAVSRNLALRGQVGHSTYVYRIPGPLTDAMFDADPRQGTRSRNYYNPDITVPSITLDWTPPAGTQVTATISAVLGPRNSVQFEGFANQPDAVLPGTGAQASRSVDVDRFRSFTGEARVVKPWSIGALEHALSFGTALSKNRMRRQQRGQGTTGSDYDLSVVGTGFQRDITYATENVAVYVENLFRLTPAWSLVPGVRAELGRTEMEGRLAYYDPEKTPTAIDHRYALIGLRTTYELPGGAEAYGGWSEAYRPQILKDVLPANALERTDPELSDSRGWTFESGVRGNVGGRYGYDVNLFELRIGDRFGTVLRTDPDGTSYLYRTNVGESRTRGVELSLEAWLVQRSDLAMWIYTASSFFHGRYLKGTVVSGGRNVEIGGNTVESVPTWISRNGLSVEAGRVSGTALVSYTSESFADAVNTVEPSANGAVGIVPAYTVVDVNGAFEATGWLRLRAGVNNLFDLQYFTKRPQFYPGPGVWPSDGRAAQVSVELRHWP